MEKLDYKKILKPLYHPTAKDFTLIDVPPLNFILVDGHGAPGTEGEYGAAVSALYSVAYKIKFMCKAQTGVDFGVMPLEGLWWAEDMNAFVTGDKDAWDWTMMILQPEPVTPELFAAAIPLVAKSKDLPALSKVRWETYAEGLCVQIMHHGPFAAEAPTLARLHQEFIPAHGYQPAGKHHEIYLNDPSKTAPERMQTILRQPVCKVQP